MKNSVVSHSEEIFDGQSSFGAVLIVCRVFPPAMNPEAVVTYKTALALASSGLHVIVLTALGNEPIQADALLGTPPNLDVFRLRDYATTSHLRRLWEDLPYSAKHRMPLRCARFARLGLKECARILREVKVAVIYARGYPDAGYMLGALAAHRFGIPLITHLSDPWPEYNEPIPYRHLSWRTAPRQILNRLWAKKVFAQSQFVTVPSANLATYMRTVDRRLARKRMIVVPHSLPNLPDMHLDGPCDKPVIALDTLHIIHTGTLDQARTPAAFLEALKEQLKAKPGSARVTFVGARWTKLQEIVCQLELQGDVVIVPACSYRDALAIAKSADVVLLIEAAMSGGIFLPSKFVDYVGVGRPILAITPSGSEVEGYLREGGGLTASPGNRDEILAAIAQLRSEKMEGILNERESTILQHHFCSSHIARTLITTFELATKIRRDPQLLMT